MRRKTIGDGISSSTALSVESRGRQNNKQNNRGRSPTRGRSRSRGKSKSKRKTIVCWNCNMEGHKKNDCMEPKKKKKAGGRQGDDEVANMVSSNEQTYRNLCLSAIVDDNSKVWYVDSGASIHCTPHRDCFCDYVHDDASRKTWIYAIRQKSDVYHTFKKWKVLVENETGNKIKCLKYDNGVSIVMEGSKNTVPITFWAAAVDTVVYLINRSPASALNGGIPEEEWSGDEYGYHLYDYEHNKIIRSRDVIFDKSRLYKHRLQEHGIEKENKEYMKLDEPENGQVPRTENPKVFDETTDTEIGAGDQQSAIHLAKNSAFHSRTKHIQLRYHFIQSLLEDGQLNLENIEGNKNPADMLTKVVDRQS
ncbi:hypothetical protein RJ639_013627 [Escallonia herrerae]|uniref:CCHC-type domain-containing protein n=1 Tax=Escallonia herrerae TaxID=1293975 RepID=A0AA89AMN1_9ASTE|nr:hypothetical protein RJ639_013627 [Escallonia herrerae]